MSGLAKGQGRGLGTKSGMTRKMRFLQRELPTMIAVAALIAVWVGLVAN